MYINEDCQKLFDELVPASGPSNCVAGELIRAVNKIGYRFYNDGDHIGRDYGNETCNAAARYLISNTQNKQGELVKAMWGLADEDEYEKLLISLEDEVTEYVMSHPELREKETDDMLDYDDPDDYRYDEDEDEDEYEY